MDPEEWVIIGYDCAAPPRSGHSRLIRTQYMLPPLDNVEQVHITCKPSESDNEGRHIASGNSKMYG